MHCESMSSHSILDVMDSRPIGASWTITRARNCRMYISLMKVSCRSATCWRLCHRWIGHKTKRIWNGCSGRSEPRRFPARTSHKSAARVSNRRCAGALWGSYPRTYRKPGQSFSLTRALSLEQLGHELCVGLEPLRLRCIVADPMAGLALEDIALARAFGHLS